MVSSLDFPFTSQDECYRRLYARIVNKQRETEAYSLIKGLEEGKLSRDVVKKPILRDSIGPVCLAA